MKTLLFYLSFLLLTNLVFAQDKTKDFDLSYGTFYIYRGTSEAIKAANSIEDKQILFSFQKDVTQEEFEKFCSKVTWIKNLEIGWGNEHVSNIDVVSKLKELEKIRLSSLKASKTKPIDLKPLRKLKNLKEVDFYATHVTNTEALKGLSNLKIVSLYMSNVNSISFVKSIEGIKDLCLYGFQHTFENYEPVTKLKNLEKLDIYMNEQAVDEKLEVLKALTNLKEISMANCNKITSLSFLENNNQMENIRASWCRGLKDFSALSNMPKLKNLSISDSQISDLSVLKDATELESIDISGTKVADISLLANCAKLTSVDISKSNVTDISPLFNCKKLWSLSVDQNVSEAQIEKIKQEIPGLRVDVKK